ncbi:hypothetical protein B0H16DRAFT_1564809 [Mycena metata]|uniref:DUF6533 domain-containing protein n=1 Tax=Mycena metata TaxID=1033252 RepID=A0AAD7IHB5_9AGAR|nr:hypothetical protein B0H16DRAFT_1564809 [Mycena metata]
MASITSLSRRSLLLTMTSNTINAAATHFLQFRLQYSSIALVYYDFALTFPKEVMYIWREKFRLSTALYIGCRYALIANVLYLLAIAKTLGSGCDCGYKIVGALSILGRAAVIVTFTMRTYVVWAENKWILGYMGFIGLACVALDITHVPGMRCVGSSTIPMSPELLSILMVVFETSAAFLTLTRCVVAFRAGGLKTQRHGLIFILFEQGMLYFFSVSIFTTAAVVLNYCAPPGFFQRLPNAFTLPLSCTLTARFILSLREWDREQFGNKARATNLSVDADGTQLGVGFGAASRISAMMAVDYFGGDPVAPATEQATDLELRVVEGRRSGVEDRIAMEGGPSHVIAFGLAEMA